LIRE
jgi:hypothetical protein